MDYMTEMEIRVFNILLNSPNKGTLHEITKGLPPEGTAQQDAMNAAEELEKKGVIESFVEFTGSCALLVWYKPKEGYENTEWYQQNIAANQA